MIAKRVPLLLAALALSVAGTLHGVLVESWECAQDPVAKSVGPWIPFDNPKNTVDLVLSTEHASDGAHALALHCPGGIWKVALTRSGTSLFPTHADLRKVFASGHEVVIDVFSDRSLSWAKLSYAVQGNDLPWTVVESPLLRMGGTTTLRLPIPEGISTALAKEDVFFEFYLIVNSRASGTIYVDNLRVE